MPFYTEPAHKLEDKFKGVDVYGWNKDEYQNREESHAITIVGAQQIDKEGYVYFMDPNDAHGPSASAKIYVMSYETLISGISNIIGVPYNIIKTPNNDVMPFVVHANQKNSRICSNFINFWQIIIKTICLRSSNLNRASLICKLY